MIIGFAWWQEDGWHYCKIGLKLALFLGGRKVYRRVMNKGVRYLDPIP